MHKKPRGTCFFQPSVADLPTAHGSLAIHSYRGGRQPVRIFRAHRLTHDSKPKFRPDPVHPRCGCVGRLTVMFSAVRTVHGTLIGARGAAISQKSPRPIRRPRPSVVVSKVASVLRSRNSPELNIRVIVRISESGHWSKMGPNRTFDEPGWIVGHAGAQRSDAA